MAESHSSYAFPRRARRLVGLAGAITLTAIGVGIVWRVVQRTYGEPARHVVVISLDTARADHFGCYGNTWIRTPRIDALADESILLTDYMTVVSTTLPSHASLFTGMYPHTHGAPRNGFVLHEDNVMLAEILKAAGFHTAGFLGAFPLARRFNFAQGFDHFDQNFSISATALGAQDERTARAVTDAVTAYLDAQGVPDRLFLFVHYFDPHAPYAPPTPYHRMYGETGGAIRPENHPALWGHRRQKWFKRCLWRHAGEVSYMDHHVGRLLDDLKRRGILDDAILVVTSDHGENLGDTAGVPFNHGWTVHQSEMHAVGMFRLPGAAHGGTRLDAPVASIDILPTVVSYLGLPMPTGVEGEVIDLTNPAGNAMSRARFGEASKPWEDVETDPRWRNMRKQRCVRVGRYKFIQTPYRGTEELYDLAADPHERNDLLATPTAAIADTAMTLRQVLEAWVARANPLPSPFEETYRDDTLRRLKALGYLSGDDHEDGSDGEGPP